MVPPNSPADIYARVYAVGEAFAFKFTRSGVSIHNYTFTPQLKILLEELIKPPPNICKQKNNFFLMLMQFFLLVTGFELNAL